MYQKEKRREKNGGEKKKSYIIRKTKDLRGGMTSHRSTEADTEIHPVKFHCKANARWHEMIQELVGTELSMKIGDLDGYSLIRESYLDGRKPVPQWRTNGCKWVSQGYRNTKISLELVNSWTKPPSRNSATIFQLETTLLPSFARKKQKSSVIRDKEADAVLWEEINIE